MAMNENLSNLNLDAPLNKRDVSCLINKKKEISPTPQFSRFALDEKAKNTLGEILKVTLK